jgi:hypothetical protein
MDKLVHGPPCGKRLTVVVLDHGVNDVKTVLPDIELEGTDPLAHGARG